MALPNTYPKITDKLTPTGIVLSIVPGDPNFNLALYRAPDAGGAPDTGNEVLVAQYPPAPLTGAFVVDYLPVDGQVFFYRFCHVRAGWTDGPKSPWTRAAKAAVLASSPTALLPIPGSFAPGAVSDESIGADGTIVFGPDGRDDLIFNGNAERGLSYWQSAATADPLPYPIPTQPAMAFGLETATPYKGTQSFKAVSAAASGGFRVVQTVRPSNGDVGSERPVIFKVRSTDTFRCRIAAKASAATSNLSVNLLLYDQELHVQGGLPIGGNDAVNGEYVGTSWTLFDHDFGPGIPSQCIWASIEIVGADADGRTLYWDDLTVVRKTESLDLVVPLTLVVP